MEILTKSQTFIFELAELGHKSAELVQTGRKCGSQEPKVVWHSFYIQTLSINLISSLN